MDVWLLYEPALRSVFRRRAASELQTLLGKGKASARRLTRARILLLAAEDRPDDEVAALLHSSRSTVERIRRASSSTGCGAEAG